MQLCSDFRDIDQVLATAQCNCVSIKALFPLIVNANLWVELIDCLETVPAAAAQRFLHKMLLCLRNHYRFLPAIVGASYPKHNFKYSDSGDKSEQLFLQSKIAATFLTFFPLRQP